MTEVFLLMYDTYSGMSNWRFFNLIIFGLHNFINQSKKLVQRSLFEANVIFMINECL